MSTDHPPFVSRRSAVVRAIALFAGAAALGAVVAHAAPAEASLRSLVPASACYVEADYEGDYLFRDGFGISNTSGSAGARARKVHCPIADFDTTFRGAVNHLFVSGFDGNNEPPNGNMDADGRVLAQICLHHDWNGASACSNFVEVTSNTQSGINFNTDIAVNTGTNDPIPLLKNAAFANAYPTLVVSVPRNGVAGWSTFHGFTAVP